MEERMKKILIISGMLIVLFSLSACNKVGMTEENKESDYKIYYLDNSETKLVSEPYELKEKDEKKQINEYVKALTSLTPMNIAYKKALPDNVSLYVKPNLDKRQLTVELDSNYLKLKGTSEILCRAAIVKTLCQVEKVNYVEFVVDGQPLKNNNDKPVGFMTEEDFIDNTGGETNYEQNALVTLFFADMDGKKLKETRVKIKYDGTIPVEQLVIEQLIKGPESIKDVQTGQLFATIPQGTKLIKASTKDGICYVDFNDTFLKKRKGLTDETVIYSIVNSLVELPAINKVQFTIDGQTIASYGEGLPFDAAFERNLDIVDSEEGE
ncbi:GerMN domain-containing protein [Lachnospiraceae bacterium WCA-693-APC-MOT-I]|uniref:GerMN domain-containing protein n=2 Tax=Velocimicrobium porci TaxID=2606634 RepID=A0A6L5Y0F1_9FIRM|nr:GerMN domain-containing protein [Velocimicrobium porci]